VTMEESSSLGATCFYIDQDISVELSKGRAEVLMNWKPEDAMMYKLFCRSLKAPGGLLCMKIGVFILGWYRRLNADRISPGPQLKDIRNRL
ncbi:hypothetical protein MKW92_018943, partial [Papaver armeniacum]